MTVFQQKDEPKKQEPEVKQDEQMEEEIEEQAKPLSRGQRLRDRN